MEAMPAGGTVFVTTYQHADGIKMSIRDTGSGVPPDKTEHIFEPFTSTKEQGTGLGLSVSYSIVEAHGGTLALIRPADGQEGAHFCMTLPKLEVS